MDSLSIFFELILIGLLITAIAYGLILDKRLKRFQDNKQSLDQLTQRLAKALDRAESAMKNLQSMSQNTGESLQKQLMQAEKLYEELSFITDRGDHLANTLSAHITQLRTAPTTPLRENSFVTPPLQQLSEEDTLPTPSQRDLLHHLGNLR